MSKEPLSKSQIFIAVAEVDDLENRSRLLAELCGDDSALRREIEELLARELELGSFLQLPPSEIRRDDVGETQTASTPTGSKAPEVSSGTIIGPYKLLKSIGEGGMGTVWLAEQDVPVKRQVALKVIKPGVGSKEIIARFEAERQALALMNHPNIARILDAGTTDHGQPYFAMELVQGLPLTKYCDQNRLGISDRLKLFTEVCSGVQHAHQKGVIHRDLKPGNILVTEVDGKPVPKVIDFGLANALESAQRLTDQSMFTGIGQILGTLKYMSPEQASLDLVDIDTRTDIYSLGVILYELLTGSTPLDDESVRGQAVLKVLGLIREQEPVRPSRRLQDTGEKLSSITNLRRTDSSSLNRILVGDLDWVVVKALEKDRSRRYESASGFAADIQRYLNNEPVVARPPSVNYRVGKFVRKNRGFVIAASTLAIALVLGMIGTTWGLRLAVVARKAESSALKKEIHQRAEAEAAKQRAETNANAAREQSQLALSTLASVINDIQGGLKDLAGGGEIRRRLLKTALAKLETVATEYVAQSVVDRNTMMALGEMGDITLQFGAESTPATGGPTAELNENQRSAVTLARSFYTRAAEIAQNRATVDPADAQAQRDLSVSHNKLGDVSLQAGNLEEAQDFYRKGLAIIEKVAAADATDMSAQRNLSISYEKLGDVTLRGGQLQDAFSFFQQALEIQNKMVMADPTNATAQRDLSKSYQNLGIVSRRTGQIEKAIGFYQQSLDIRKKLAMANPHDVRAQLNLSGSFDQLGDMSLQAGLPAKALEDYQQALDIRKVVASADPNDAVAQRGLSLSFVSLGNASRETGRAQEAMDFYRQAFEITQQLAAVDPADGESQRDLSVVCISLGDIGVQTGQVQEALGYYRKVLGIRETLAAENSTDARAQRDLSLTYERLGDLTMQLGQLDEALDFYLKKVEIDKKVAAADPADTRAQSNLSIVEQIGRREP